VRAPGAAERSARWRALATFLLAGAAFLYLTWVLHREAASAAEALSSLSLGNSLVALAMALLMHLLKTSYYLEVCRRLGAPIGAAGRLAHAYAVAQVARYLPGKIWGVAYQIGSLGDVFPARKIILAHIVQMFQTNLLAVGVLVAMLDLLVFHQRWPIVIAVAVLVLVELFHRWPALERIFLQLWAKLRARPELVESDIGASPARSSAILLAEWLAYYAMWFFLLGERLPLHELALLATWYAAASLLAIFAFVVPGGLAVREAIFVLLAGSAHGAGAAIVQAALLRVLLISAEALAVGVVRWIGGRLMIAARS
jgi:hypothetical protein